MSDCIFCKIANGEIPSYTVYEDDTFRVIMDLGPASPGHMLILAKEHYANLFELPDEIAEKAMLLAKKMAKTAVEALGADGVNIVQNNGAAAEQTVMHYHLHVIPRYENGKAFLLWDKVDMTNEEIEEKANLLKKQLQ